MTLEAGEKVQASLQEGLSHQQFLKETLSSELLEKLEKNASDALREAEAHRTSLKESLKVFDFDDSLFNTWKLSANFVSL